MCGPSALALRKAPQQKDLTPFLLKMHVIAREPTSMADQYVSRGTLGQHKMGFRRTWVHLLQLCSLLS